VVVVPDRPADAIYVDLEELRRLLDVRERAEREEVARALSADVEPCRCKSCIEADIKLREDRESGRRWGRWDGI
jgi:hypothetical protein